MPAGEITFDTWASSQVIRAESTWYQTNVSEINASNLVNGTNTIAVEIHQYSPTSSDVSFDLQLTAVANAFILISPPNGAALFDPPTFEWTSGPYNAFLFYSIFSYGGYGYYPVYFWLSDTSFQMPANWWDLLAADERCYWAVIGVNRRTWDWEVSDVWLFKKAPGQCPQFDEGFPTGTIKIEDLDEASGLAASQKNPYVLWTHNDSGDSARVFAMNALGTHLGTYNLSGASNRDWEDIAIGPGPIDGVDYLYIGEIGDNSAVYPSIKVYRVPEPQADANQPAVNLTLTGVETITLQYPDGARDAETLMVDPVTKDIYIISKRDDHPRVYRAAYPQSTSQTITMEYKCELLWQYQTLRDWVTAGDISPNGLEVIVRSYDSASIWQRPTNGNLWDAFAQPECPVQLLTETETWGEAICFVNGGYMTTSEGKYSAINYFPRISD